MTDATASPGRRAVRVGILSHGTSQFDSRAHRVARTLAAAGDTVTVYSRHLPGLPMEEEVDGYRVVRIAVSRYSLRQAAAEDPGSVPAHMARLAGQQRPAKTEPTTDGQTATQRLRAAWAAGPTEFAASLARVPIAFARKGWRVVRRAWHAIRRRVDKRLEAIPLTARFLLFPINPWKRAGWFAEQVEPHDVWHGMWAASLPVLHRVKARHGGRTVYDSRDVFLRARIFASMPGWRTRSGAVSRREPGAGGPRRSGPPRVRSADSTAESPQTEGNHLRGRPM